MRYVVIFFLVCAAYTIVNAQVIIKEELIEVDKSKISFINADLDKLVELYQKQIQRANRYAELTGTPISRMDSNGNLVQLVGVDDAGTPMFISTDNAGAAVTTGANVIRDGDLKLEGSGIQIGIWDGGGIGHTDFETRIISSQGTPSVHANHVAGTILSSGIGNVSAKGMAPKATAHTFDFGNDFSEMTGLVSGLGSELVLSNHSYGLITGWRFDNGWTWFGNQNISTQEDYRFGFYSAAAASWDQLSYSSPNYLIVKSAGNDRSDTGNNPAFPADCNGGTGYDCISDVSTAKNILTVGAVGKISNYTGPESVGMSTFSGWGPTDDGRIKPDLVAAGVNLFSTSTNNAYTTLSGTSMATPNTTGSLALLQELYKKRNGTYLSAASLKALAIHTVKEAGSSPGPDYRFGWGLLDVNAAANLILAENGTSTDIREYTLSNGGEIDFQIYPKPNTKVKITIVWADVPGTPTALALDPANNMLVNDLDLRIKDDDGETVFPWILSMTNFDAPATRGDNNKDNVEKIEFDNPLLRPYTVTVNHKNNLVNNSQKFSMIIEYTPFVGNGNAYYWVGGSGNWDDPSHWSLQSGGSSANTVPGKDDRVFFDSNSFPNNSSIISLAQPQEVYAFSWLSNKNATLDGNGHSLSVGTNYFLINDKLSFSEEIELRLTGEDPVSNTIDLSNGSYENLEINIHSDNPFTIVNANSFKKLSITNASVQFLDTSITLKELTLNNANGKAVNLSGSALSLTNVEQVNLNGNSILWNISGDVTLNYTGVEATLNLGSNLVPVKVNAENATINFNNDFTLEALEASQSTLYFNTNNSTVNSLNLTNGTIFSIGTGKKVNLIEEIQIQSTAAEKVMFTRHGVGNNGVLYIPGRMFLCFDHLTIQNVDVQGSTFVNAGTNSSIAESAGWLTKSCNDVVYPDFQVEKVCIGSLVKISNISLGNPDSYQWDFGDSNVENLTPSNNANPSIIYNNTGNRVITLHAIKNGETSTYQKTIEVVSNPLAKPSVNLVGNNLISSITSTGYQWYKNFEPIESATQRSFNYLGNAGAFSVAISNNNCNIISEPYIIANVELQKEATALFPNPATDQVCIQSESKITRISITDYSGRKIIEIANPTNNCIGVGDLPTGLYLVEIENSKTRKVERLVIE